MNPIDYALFICLGAVERTPEAELNRFDKEYLGDRFYDRSEYEYFIKTQAGKHYLSKVEISQMLEAYRSSTGLAGRFWHEEKAETLGLTDIN